MDYVPPYIPAEVISNPPGRGLVAMSEAATAGADGPMLVLPGRGSIEGVRFTAHPKGGGYIGWLQIMDGKKWSPNLVAYRFGRGIQATIRDWSPWNPNQGGFRDVVGTPVRIVKSATRLFVSAFRVPLFQNQELDFTEKENEAPDDFTADNGTDQDRLNDTAAGLTNQYGEAMSEARMSAVYDRQPTINGIPAFRYRYHFAYHWPYGAMAQFHGNAVTEDGPVWDPGYKTPGFTDQDWHGINMSMGMRMADIAGWTFTHYSVGSTMNLQPIPKSGEDRTRTYVGVGEDLKMLDPGREDGRPIGQQNKFKRVATGLVLGIISAGGSANTSRAIGLYMPRSATNRDQVVTPTGAENRRMSTAFLFVRDGEQPPESNMVLRTLVSGMRQGEALFGDVIFLFGTPNEILVAARNIEANQ